MTSTPPASADPAPANPADLISERAKAVRAARLTYLSPAKLLRIERLLAEIRDARVPGALLEFGVALGGSAILIADEAAPERPFHGFDVFSMIPEPTSEKDDEKSRERYAVIRSGASKGIGGGGDYYGYRDDLHGDVLRSFADFGLDPEAGWIRFHVGLFEDTLPGVETGPVAFAHVDCDWYDPVTLCLGWLRDRMSPGGAIILDDYHDYGGARTATDEFIAANPGFAFEPGPNPVIRKL
ncbi:MAG: asparagine synthase [Rhodobacteraceae bacterium]|nr:asparagine synthase [Paracoccaceae bacterium]MBR25990.1 asparagine synthase [Paracoccaceae bacterium]